MRPPPRPIDDLVRHIDRVREVCLLLGKRLMAGGRQHFGRLLIAHGYVHDASKFYGIEWDYLHAGRDVLEEKMTLAIEHHRHTNPHHPEHWGGIDNMPEIYVAEMVCDWFARSQEFGTDLRQWIRQTAVPRYGIDPASQVGRWIEDFVELLLAKPYR